MSFSEGTVRMISSTLFGSLILVDWLIDIG